MIHPVFDIYLGKPINDHQWVIHGRALEDIKVGDTLILSNKDNNDDLGCYTVYAIAAYGQTFTNISAGLSAALTIEGSSNTLIEKAMILGTGA